MKHSVTALVVCGVLIAACVTVAVGGGAGAPAPGAKPPALTPGAESALCAMVTTSSLIATDPAVILALKDDLKLTAEQVKDLTDSVQTLVAAGKKRLKPEQAELLKALGPGPISMASVHAQVDPKGACPMLAAFKKGTGVGALAGLPDTPAMLWLKAGIEAKFDPAYPAVLQAVAQYLNIDSKQAEGLRTDMEAGRMFGASVLTGDQREILRPVEGRPLNGLAMHELFETEAVARNAWPNGAVCPVVRKAMSPPPPPGPPGRGG